MKALDVSNLFLEWAHKNGDGICNLKMQKLLYYAYVWYLVEFKKPLFEDSIEARAFGPVVRGVFDVYKDSCFCPIRQDCAPDTEKLFTKKQLDFLGRIYQNFIPFTAKELTHMSMAEEPWLKSYKKNETAIIADLSMKSFYKNLLGNPKKDIRKKK